MPNNPREDALLKTILLQRKMIEDIRTLHNYFQTALQVLCGLDSEFKHAYFAKILASDPCRLPGPLPDKDTLTEALKSLGWTTQMPDPVSFWSPFSQSHAFTLAGTRCFLLKWL